MNKQNRNRCIDTDNTVTLARWRGIKGMGEKCKGLRSTSWQLQNSHRDVKYSTRNVVNNTVITMYGARWVPEIMRGSLCKIYDCLNTLLYT